MTKKELIELLKEAIEINPRVVERVRDFVKHAPRWENEKWIMMNNTNGKHTLQFTETLESNLNKLKVNEILGLVKNI